MLRRPRSLALALALLGCALALAACNDESPMPLASNCKGDDPDECKAKPQPLEQIDAVDIMLVVDNSGSITGKLEKLKEQLPRLLNAIVNGGEGDASFPPASSVHIAVASTDMGAHQPDIIQCEGNGDDGVFVRPGLADLSCERSYPSFLSFDGEEAAVATVDSVACVPFLGMEGCGFEQPLEAGLKALWPASNPDVSFLDGPGHGEDENDGFLRDDSLLVVVVVEDEDDCSASDPTVFAPPSALEPSDPLASQGLNTRCALNPERLYDVERYVAGFKALHADHPERVIFATIAGIPAELLSDSGINEISDPEARDEAYDALLADSRMQLAIDGHGSEDPGDDGLQPSCDQDDGQYYPPVRLVQVARGFGTQGVLGSLCGDDFGDTTGMLIRAIGQRLTEAANGPTDAGSK